MKACWPVSLSCEVLEVSVSGYFEHQRRQQRRRASQPGSGRVSDEALLAHMRAIHAEVRQEYGWPRMTKELCARGHRVSKERVRRLMQQHGIKARGRSLSGSLGARHSMTTRSMYAYEQEDDGGGYGRVGGDAVDPQGAH